MKEKYKKYMDQHSVWTKCWSSSCVWNLYVFISKWKIKLLNLIFGWWSIDIAMHRGILQKLNFVFMYSRLYMGLIWTKLRIVQQVLCRHPICGVLSEMNHWRTDNLTIVHYFMHFVRRMLNETILFPTSINSRYKLINTKLCAVYTTNCTALCRAIIYGCLVYSIGHTSPLMQVLRSKNWR